YVYITGSHFTNYANGSQPPPGDGSIELVKLNTDGNLVWIKNFDGNLNRTLSRSLALDSSKNVFISGFYDTNDFDKLLVIKYCNTCTSFPDVSVNIPQDTFCLTNPSYLLSGGSPSGGTFS